jgi:hypothetical protein
MLLHRTGPKEAGIGQASMNYSNHHALFARDISGKLAEKGDFPLIRHSRSLQARLD